MIDSTSPSKVPAVAVCLGLAVITFAVFGQTLHHQFVGLDDDVYVYENPMVAKGLTLKGALWALTYGRIGHWHPLTWVSHMLDCQIYGLNPGGHHLTNVLLHTATAILLFLALRQMTGALWRSAFVAAVFAIHPLRAESVAWIAERKDVLSGVFFMLTLGAYARYARQPSRVRYAAVAVWFGLGLLCKNTLVTLPFVLLLLDWWPLRRLTPFWGLVKEKIPLFLLSVGSCVATFLVPEKTFGPGQAPFFERIGNAVVSYGIYLRQMVYPAGLAIPYLYPPNGLSFREVALAVAVLAAISISALAWRNKFPYLLAGWLWYLGMLVPAIGIIQISYYARADRYTYLPGIGLVLAVTWAVGDWSAGWKHRQAVLGGMMALVISALMVCAWIQNGYWKSSETLWIHTLACTTGNYVADLNFGNDLSARGKVDEAITHYQSAVKIKPGYAEAHVNLGNALLRKGSVDAAIVQYQNALQIMPDSEVALCNLGNALLQTGRVDEAIVQYQNALQIKPDYADARVNLGVALLKKGRTDEAVAQYQMALHINPANANAQNNLGQALLQQGHVGEAIAHFQMALQIKPDEATVQNNLAWLLATSADASLRNGNKAVELATQANTLTGGENPLVLHTLAAALAEAGRFSEAVETAQRALPLAEAQSNTGLAGQLQLALKLYQAGKPFRYPARKI